MSTYQLIDVTTRRNAVIVSIKEEYLSTSIAAEILENDLQQVISLHRPAILVLDFSHVKMTSSSTIGKLLVIHKRLAGIRRPTALVLCFDPDRRSLSVRWVCRTNVCWSSIRSKKH